MGRYGGDRVFQKISALTEPGPGIGRRAWPRRFGGPVSRHQRRVFTSVRRGLRAPRPDTSASLTARAAADGGCRYRQRRLAHPVFHGLRPALFPRCTDLRLPRQGHHRHPPRPPGQRPWPGRPLRPGIRWAGSGVCGLPDRAGGTRGTGGSSVRAPGRMFAGGLVCPVKGTLNGLTPGTFSAGGQTVLRAATLGSPGVSSGAGRT